MSPDLYRLSWEMVKMGRLGLYCNADPAYFKGVTQTVPNSRIADEEWEPISKETDDPWQQYDALRRRADKDRGFVRNVRLRPLSQSPKFSPLPGDGQTSLGPERS